MRRSDPRTWARSSGSVVESTIRPSPTIASACRRRVRQQIIVVRRSSISGDEFRGSRGSNLSHARTLQKERRMTDTAGSTHITQVGTVFVPVADQDGALAFYLDKLGFETRVDFVYGGGLRWIEVAPPGAVNSIALVPPGEGASTRDDAAHCAFASDDIEADHATLLARGVDVDAEIAREGTSRPGLSSLAVRVPDPVPAQFFFRDIDGNRFLIVGAG
jgi:catechol 2,3-dioxygenase-like lactoylglutathione lyase family enzyme